VSKLPPTRSRSTTAATPRRAVAEVPLEDFNESWSTLIYGYPGVGKTVLASTAPNAVFVACEPGVRSAQRAGSRAGMCRINNDSDAWQWLEDAQNNKYAHRDFVIIDTITMLQRKFMRGALEEMVAKRPDRDRDLPDRPEHQLSQNRLKRWVEQVVDLPHNVIFLAHCMRVEDSEGGAMTLPTIEGGADKGFVLANYVMALMSSVGYMGVKTFKDGSEVRRIVWQPTHDPNKDILYTAKDQLAAFGRFTDNTTIPDLLAMIGDVPNQAAQQRRKRAN
jgi:AAA domain